MSLTRTLLLLPALAIAGCSMLYATDAGENFGVTVKGATAAQIANPGPARTAAVPLAIDGEVAKNAVDNYYTSYETPPAPVNVFNIGVGTIGSTGSSSR